MTKIKKQFCLDLTFCLGESFFDGQCLSKVERLLCSEALPWPSELYIWRDDEKKRRSVKSFAIDVQKAATEQGALYGRLIKEHGAGPFARRSGSVELRGADGALIVVLNLDDFLFAPSAGRWLWRNTLTMQLREPRARANVAIEFTQRFAESSCAELSPWYAHGHLIEEWDRKNISREGGGMVAKGIDAFRYLPGLYWLNFFGEPYCALIGKERLLNTPAVEAKEIDAGILLYVSSTPESWDTPGYQAAETAVLSHLGEQHFFNPHDSSRRTVAPDFGLESLPRNPRFS